jgi:hypothetical protein
MYHVSNELECVFPLLLLYPLYCVADNHNSKQKRPEYVKIEVRMVRIIYTRDSDTIENIRRVYVFLFLLMGVLFSLLPRQNLLLLHQILKAYNNHH